MSYGITGWTPGGDRQSLTYSLKAGQKRGMGRANIVSNNIVINNFGAMPRGIDMYYNHSCCNNNNSLSKFEKWMLGIGTVFGGVGTILGAILGGGSAEGAGDSGQKAEDTVEEKTEPKPDAKPQISEKQQKENAEIAEQKAKAADFINGQITKAKDSVLGSKADISGTVTVGENGEVSIKDQQNTYTYQKTGRTVNYKGTEYPVYTLTGATNNTTGKEVPTTTQEYILMNGELVQPSDCSELAGLGTGSILKNTASSAGTQKTQSTASSSKKTGYNNVQYTAAYSVTTPSGNKFAVKVDKDGKYHYFNSKNQEIDAQTFNKQTGTTGSKVASKYQAQKEVQNWNKQHPDKQVTYANGKYSTQVSTISTTRGKVGKTITANSFDELKTLVNEYINSVNNSTNKYSTGGYSGLGGMIRH